MTGAEQLALPLFVQGNAYQSAAHTYRTALWRSPEATANTAILPHLTTLRNRSRQAVRNDGYAYGVIDKLTSNIVGTGIKPRSLAQDEDFRKEVQALWAKWVKHSNADGPRILDYYGQQRQAVWAWLEAGEVFIRLRPRRTTDGLPVPLQLQLLEAEMCPHTYDRVLSNGNKVRAGIEFNSIGRRVAYYFFDRRPGDLQDFDQSRLRRVPAARVLHVWDPLRPGQLRGTPHLTRALIRLNELARFDDATLLRQQIANLFAIFVETPGPGDPSDDFNPLTGRAPDGSRGDRPVVGLEAGISHELSPGEKVTFSDPPDPANSYPSFMKQQLMAVAAATGVPYEVLTGDMTGLNDRVMRVILHEFRRGIQTRQNHIIRTQLNDPTWDAWILSAFQSQALDIPPEFITDPMPWAAVRWHAQGWPYIHPVQDVDSAQKAIDAGLNSRESVVAAQGEDVEVIDEAQRRDNERTKRLGLEYTTSTAAASGQGSTT